MKRFLLLSLLCGCFGFFAVSNVSADCVDTDKDGYFSCSAEEDTLSPFAKGREEIRCDQVTITQDTEDAGLVIAPDITSVPGNKVNPGEIEAPNSKIDSNCDGEITGYLPEGRGGDSDLFGLIEKIIVLIGQVAVFVSVGALVYGGIMFATASGDEMKIQKAKKTIIGAVIGLAIGLIAWNIVGFVTETLG